MGAAILALFENLRGTCHDKGTISKCRDVSSPLFTDFGTTRQKMSAIKTKTYGGMHEFRKRI
jgi:hypothetical protein